ncbi:MFS transporter [Nocardia jejuensis]|uniref:MFS transporter n=1 Tax=Nocardia jejuensis TaxID=328049 RepID=UPI0008347680|nr:MFS transporter [Nocardia jejuensis]
MSLDSRDGRVESLTRSRLTLYGVGSVGTAVFATVPGLLLLYFLTDILGVAAGIAGLVVVLPKLWDVIFNPIVGAASDREAVRTGRRTGLMLRGAVALPVLFAVMFMSPFTGAGGAVWVAAVFVLAATAYALFQVPYVGLPAEMAADPAARTAVTARRVIYLTIGILLGGGLAPALAAAGGGGRAGYLLMGVVIGVLMLGALLAAALGTRWVPSSPGRSLGLVAAVRSARGNRAFFALLIAYVVHAVAVAAMLAAAPYIATYWLGGHGLTSVLFVCLVAPSALAVPVWEKLARRVGRLRCLAIATVGYAVGALLLLPGIAFGGRAPALALIAFLGICYAALQLLPLALLPDTVLADADRTGQSQAGTFTGLWTAGETAGMALGPGLFSVVLAISGYSPTTWDVPLIQSDGARLGMLLGFTLAPAALMLASLPALRAFGHRRTPAPGTGPLDSEGRGYSPQG